MIQSLLPDSSNWPTEVNKINHTRRESRFNW